MGRGQLARSAYSAWSDVGARPGRGAGLRHSGAKGLSGRSDEGLAVWV